ncbi:ABC transporter permease [Rhodococcus sp. T2V]|uniref:ABC transporter permease n=1 Tax=Rhodococcus sp. T2V TaxID=3034164 RepID=UPI0023E2B84C|nr:ABC transporter permease [Rhodococcus sp. T2V]MDF3310628.1 ABC transporter permease [Rhodococcus sp. T2V]
MSTRTASADDAVIARTHGEHATDPRTSGQLLKRLASTYYLQGTLLAAIILSVFFVPNFATTGNAQNILTQASFAGLVACGMTLLIIGGQFDLSVAGIIGVAAVVTAKVLPATTIGIAVLVALGVGAALGAINGVIVTKIRIPPFIATFGMYNVYLASAFIITSGNVVGISSVHYQELGISRIAGIPVVFLVFLLCCVAVYALVNRTYFGRKLRTVGSNETAARLAGVRVDRVKIIAFAVAGLLTGVAAAGLSALLSSANGTMAQGMELNAIAISVVGGTALRGGRGTILGTFTAALLITLISNALNLLQVQSYWQSIVTGAILIVALVVGGLRKDAVRGAA